MATLSLSAIVNPYHYRTSTAPRLAVTVSRCISMHSAVGGLAIRVRMTRARTAARSMTISPIRPVGEKFVRGHPIKL